MVVTSFSIAILQLAFEIQTDFKYFLEASPALQSPSIHRAVAKELHRLSVVACTWKARPSFEIALRSFAGIPLSVQTSNFRGQESGQIQSSMPFLSQEKCTEKVPNHPFQTILDPRTITPANLSSKILPERHRLQYW